MADISADPSAIAEGLKALGGLSTTLQWMLFAAFVLWVVVWRGLAWWDSHQANKRRIADEAAAAKLAKAEADARTEQVEAVNRLCTVLEQHTSDEDNNAHRLNQSLSDLNENMKSVSVELRTLHERMSLKMSRGDSLTAIEDKLNDGVASKVMEIFDQSLRENNYAERAAFIRNKVKTAIGEALEHAQKKLETSYHLSVDLAPFFPIRDGSGAGVRHVLCDILWEAVEPLYRQSSPVEERIEEMRVVVTNRIADQVTTGIRETQELHRREMVGV